MAKDGSVVVDTELNNDGFNKGIDSMKGGFSKIKSIAGTALKGIAIGAAAVTTGMIAIGKSAVDSYADYEQLIGGVEILFKDRQPIDSYNKIYAILDKSETNKYNYTIYAYDGSVNIKIDDKEYSLKDALLESKITMEEIIQKANKDLDNNKITGDMYKDGGSMIYQYDTYTIIKCHTIEGNRDVYIGTKEMTLNDVK